MTGDQGADRDADALVAGALEDEARVEQPIHHGPDQGLWDSRHYETRGLLAKQCQRGARYVQGPVAESGRSQGRQARSLDGGRRGHRPWVTSPVARSLIGPSESRASAGAMGQAPD